MKSLKLFHMNSNMFPKNYRLRLNSLLYTIFPIWAFGHPEQLSVLHFLPLIPGTKQPFWLITFPFITLHWNHKNEKHQKSGQPSIKTILLLRPACFLWTKKFVLKSSSVISISYDFIHRAVDNTQQLFSWYSICTFSFKTSCHHPWLDHLSPHLHCLCPMKFASTL